jgi:predicted MPP superfamily phosphohydrolase
MVLLIILTITEVFAPMVLRQHLFGTSKPKYYIALIIHIILSMWLWLLFLDIKTNNSFYDNPRNVWIMLNLKGMIMAVVIPRLILVICHFSGRLARIKSGGYIGWLTNTGFITAILIFTIFASGTLHGRFNFKTEDVTIKIKGLNKDLDGFRIVQLSDLHLAGFYHHRKLLQKVIEDVNNLNADLILNTGDFVSYGWREFDRADTILSKAKGKYGNIAVMGNHDFGTYHPDFTEADRDNNVLIMNNLIKASGYKVLNDSFTIVKTGDAKIAVIGIITMGHHPDITHGNLEKAMSGVDSADLKILLSHDPNFWKMAVTGKTDIDITLSGHTHGMQMGLLTRFIRWSPAKYFYPNWNGLYSEGDQFQYVNRGLGVLAVPFRLCMPPEITVITLRNE